MVGGGRRDPDDKPQKILRAFDINTGKFVWELPQEGPGDTWTGTLSTAGGLVFFGDDGGALARRTPPPASGYGAIRSPNNLHTSPMTYMFDNKQYVAIAAGGNLFSFALVEQGSHAADDVPRHRGAGTHASRVETHLDPCPRDRRHTPRSAKPTQSLIKRPATTPPPSRPLPAAIPTLKESGGAAVWCRIFCSPSRPQMQHRSLSTVNRPLRRRKRPAPISGIAW